MYASAVTHAEYPAAVVVIALMIGVGAVNAATWLASHRLVNRRRVISIMIQLSIKVLSYGGFDTWWTTPDTGRLYIINVPWDLKELFA
jgi:NO-binding membrane sensor protein with MHYT domain